MPSQTFPDGFPISVQEAINFSYFLSDAEKAEWNEWVKTANTEQQNELIETLHAIWQENQKEAIPNGFDNKTPQSSQPVTQKPVDVSVVDKDAIPVSPEPQSPTVSVTTPTVPTTPVTIAENKITPPPITEPTATPSVKISQPVTEPTLRTENSSSLKSTTPVQTEKSTTSLNPQSTPTPKEDFVFNNTPTQPDSQTVSTPTGAQSTPTPVQTNPVNSTREVNASQQNKDPRKFESRNKQNNSNGSNNNQNNNLNQRPQTHNNNQTNKPNQTSQPVEINFTKIKQTATELELAELTKNYKNSVSELEKYDTRIAIERSELAQKSDDSMQNLVLKMSTILGNFESVSGYLEEMTAKLLKMRDVITAESSENQKLRSTIEIKILALEEKVEFNVRDVDRVYRELRDLKDEMRRNDQDLRTKVNINKSDVYLPGEAVNQKIDLLNSKLVSIQKQLDNTKSLDTLEKTNQKTQGSKKNLTVDTPKDNSKIITTEKSSNNGTIIDLRNIV